jgi:hypothetical protein
MIELKIKCCPFCGKDGKIERLDTYPDESGSFRVNCSKEHCSASISRWFVSKESAIRYWNTRLIPVKEEIVSTNCLRHEFLRLLTEDSDTNDRRKKEFNQAIFDKKEGWQVFNGTDLFMVMDRFNKAVKNLERTRK